MSKILKHIHKLKRISYTNGERIYFCIKGECEYEINIRKALGKPNECHRCGKTFSMNERSVRLAKPHCNECTRRGVEEADENKIHISVPDKSLSAVNDLRSRLNQITPKPLSIDESKSDEDLL